MNCSYALVIKVIIETLFLFTSLHGYNKLYEIMTKLYVLVIAILYALYTVTIIICYVTYVCGFYYRIYIRELVIGVHIGHRTPNPLSIG